MYVEHLTSIAILTLRNLGKSIGPGVRTFEFLQRRMGLVPNCMCLNNKAFTKSQNIDISQITNENKNATL